MNAPVKHPVKAARKTPHQRVREHAEQKSAPAQQRRLIDPSELPEVYAMICSGTCLEPTVADGATLVFSKAETYQAGDYVILWYRPECVREGEHQARIKRVQFMPPPWVKFPYRDHPKSEVGALFLVEQLNPRTTFAVNCCDLLAVHKASGIVPGSRVPGGAIDTNALVPIT